MPDRDRPAPERDCLDCGSPGGMKLHNLVGNRPTIPLLYICDNCGTTITIPPPRSPALGS